MIAFFDHSKDLTANISTLYFRTNDRLDYLAGQYAEIIIPKIHESRWYTLSSSPTEKLLAITTKYQEPISNFKVALKSLKKNEPIRISDAIGDFVLPKDPSVPIIYVSGGIGITPVRSIVKSLIDTNQKRNVQLIYAVKDRSELIYEDILKNYKLSYIPLTVKNSLKPQAEITPKRVLSLANYNKDSLFFVSGPQQMVETICAGLENEIPRDHIVMDYFPGYLGL